MKQFIIFFVVCCSTLLNAAEALSIPEPQKSATRIFLPLEPRTIRWTLQDIAPKHEGCISIGQLLQKTINLKVINKCLKEKQRTPILCKIPVIVNNYQMWIREANSAILQGKDLASSAVVELHEDYHMDVSESISDDLRQTMPFRALVLHAAILNWKSEEAHAMQYTQCLQSIIEQIIKSDTTTDQ